MDEKKDISGAPERDQDKKIGEAIIQAMGAIDKDKREKLRKEPGKLLNYINHFR